MSFSRIYSLFVKAWVFIVWNKLTACNAGLFGLVIFLAYAVNGGAGPNPEVKFWTEGASSFNLPMQIMIGMAVFLALSLIGISVVAFAALRFAQTSKQIFYAKYTAVMFFIAAFACILVLACPTIPGASFRIALFSFIATQSFVFGLFDTVITMFSVCNIKRTDLSTQ